MSYASNLNTYLNPTPETIVRRGNYESTGYNEAPASGSLVAPYPGMLIQLNSDGTVSVCTQAGGGMPKIFAVEDALQGYTINDQYSQGDIVRYINAEPGHILQGVIPAGFSTSIGTMLQSYGDGSLVPQVASAGTVLYVTNANSTAISNTAAETAFDQYYVFPAKELVAGDVLHIVAQGKINNIVANNTVNVKLKVGSTTIVATGAVAPAASDEFYIDTTLVVRTVGGSGTFVAGGVEALGTSGTVTSKAFYLDSTALNTNANANFTVTATFNAAAVNNNIQMNILSIERMRTTPGASIAQALTAVNNSAGTGYEFVDVLIL